VNPLISKLQELKSPERLTVNTQFEQVAFKELGPSMTLNAMVEQVQINEADGPQSSLILAVINDLIKRFQQRKALPFQSMRHFKDFASDSNNIRVRVTGVPFHGPESFAFLLIADRLLELRPSYLEAIGDKVAFEGTRGEDSKFKSLSDEDVWYSHMEIADDQSIILTFLVLTFDVLERMKDYSVKIGNSKINSLYTTQRGNSQLNDEKPWYGTKRYDIVDHVLKM
jgi:hypothetical protein